jgi:hypothetical protein
MGCFSIASKDRLSLCIRQLSCHLYIVQSTHNATIIITGKTLSLELGLIAFLVCDLSGNIIDII